MPAFNIVRFVVKPGMDQQFLDAHGPGKAKWPGLIRGTKIKTSNGCFCLIGEWTDAAALAAARPQMIATLDTFRDILVPMASGLTDAESGPAVLTLA